MKLSEAWELYLADKQLEKFSPVTLESYRVQKNLLVRHFGDKDINEITIFDLKQYLIEKGGHLKASSLGARIRFIRAFFKWLSDEGYCTKNPTTKLKEPKLGSRIPKALTDEEAELQREACRIPQEHALTEFLFSTGCRVGEVHRLNRSDVNLENRSCLVIGKGDKQREVYFSRRAKIWLKWYLDSRNDDCPALFVTQRRPYRRLSIDMIRYVVKRVCRQSNSPKNTYPHIWRHTFAMHMLDKGAPLEAIQDQLGHADLRTTKIYCRLSGARRKEIHDRYF